MSRGEWGMWEYAELMVYGIGCFIFVSGLAIGLGVAKALGVF